MMRAFLFSLQFLTILPVQRHHELPAQEIGRTVRYFPIVGLIIGLIVAIGAKVFGGLMEGAAADALTLALWVLITGALHLDGLADASDGLYAGKQSDEVLRIMRDSHTGVMGVVAVALVLLLKLAGLLSLPASGRFLALAILPVMGRWSMVQLMGSAQYVRAEGIGRDFADHIQTTDVRAAALITFILSLACLGWSLGIVVFVLGWAFTWVAELYLARRVGGITGDCLGAVGEVMEVFTLFLILLVRT